MKDEQQIRELFEVFMRVMNTVHKLYQAPRDFGTGELLHAAEIQAIETIGYHPGINVSEFAEQKGITTGAVSQLINKLEKKGLVARLRDPVNSKVTLLKLTMQGEVAFHHNRLFHLKLGQEFFGELAEMPLENREILLDFFAKIEAYSHRIQAFNSVVMKGAVLPNPKKQTSNKQDK